MVARAKHMTGLLTPIARRLKRSRRRRKVGRAYDMAIEIAKVLDVGDKVLDVGCGNGFIAHHLSNLLRKSVVGLDVSSATSAHIDYVAYDGKTFPILDCSFDAVLLCYVLHHAQNPLVVLAEVQRVLKKNGVVIVYEDNPGCWWDRAVCWLHNQQWQGRTGRCTFQLNQLWTREFRNAGFKVLRQRSLSRWRNFAHPVSRHFFVLEAELKGSDAIYTSRPEAWSNARTRAA